MPHRDLTFLFFHFLYYFLLRGFLHIHLRDLTIVGDSDGTTKQSLVWIWRFQYGMDISPDLIKSVWSRNQGWNLSASSFRVKFVYFPGLANPEVSWNSLSHRIQFCPLTPWVGPINGATHRVRYNSTWTRFQNLAHRVLAHFLKWNQEIQVH